MNLDLAKQMYETIAGDRNRLFSFVVTPDGDIVEGRKYIADLRLSVGQIKDALIVIPGSFNPLHDAHRQFFDKAPERYGGKWRKVRGLFELSINRRDKEPLSFEDLVARLEQFKGYAPVWVTNAAFFFEKTGLLYVVNPHFEVGYDTAERLIENHGVSMVQGMRAKFTVNPRKIGDKVWTLDDLKDKFGEVPNNMSGRYDYDDTVNLSSTSIRNGAK